MLRRGRLIGLLAENIDAWFNNFEEDIVQLGFGTCDKTGVVYIPPEQPQWILNLDETCLSLDGSSTNRGVCPDCVINDP